MTNRKRKLSWTPEIVSNLSTQTDESLGSQAPSALLPAHADGFWEGASDLIDPKAQRQADLRFSIGVALALALPAVIGFGIYEAARSIILIAS